MRRLIASRNPEVTLRESQLHSPELIGKRLQLLRKVVPDLRRVAVLRGVPFEGPGFMLTCRCSVHCRWPLYGHTV